MPPMPRDEIPQEERIKHRMLSIFSTQEGDAEVSDREKLLRNHYVGWKDFNKTVHTDPHPDDGYLPLNLWDSIG